MDDHQSTYLTKIKLTKNRYWINNLIMMCDQKINTYNWKKEQIIKFIALKCNSKFNTHNQK